MTTENKSIIERALTTLITTGDVTALASWLRDDFVHHRPDATRNKAEWLAAVRALPLADLRVEIQHVLAEGAYVAMHSRRWLVGAGPGIAGVDVWRLEDGLIVEGWEVIETVADASDRWVWWKSSVC